MMYILFDIDHKGTVAVRLNDNNDDDDDDDGCTHDYMSINSTSVSLELFSVLNVPPSHDILQVLTFINTSFFMYPSSVRIRVIKCPEDILIP